MENKEFSLANGFWFVLQQIIMDMNNSDSRVNIFTMIRNYGVRKRCLKTLEVLKGKRYVNIGFFINFISLIENNRDMFPENLFTIYHTEKNEIVFKFFLTGYDYLKNAEKYFSYFYHDKSVKIIINTIRYELSIRINIIQDNLMSNKKYKDHIGLIVDLDDGIDNGLVDMSHIYTDDETMQIAEFLNNIMLICAICYIRGDYDGINRCFRQ